MKDLYRQQEKLTWKRKSHAILAIGENLFAPYYTLLKWNLFRKGFNTGHKVKRTIWEADLYVNGVNGHQIVTNQCAEENSA